MLNSSYEAQNYKKKEEMDEKDIGKPLKGTQI